MTCQVCGTVTVRQIGSPSLRNSHSPSRDMSIPSTGGRGASGFAACADLVPAAPSAVAPASIWVLRKFLRVGLGVTDFMAVNISQFEIGRASSAWKWVSDAGN